MNQLFGLQHRSRTDPVINPVGQNDGIKRHVLSRLISIIL